MLLSNGSSFGGESESGLALRAPHIVWGLTEAPLVHGLQAYAVHQHCQFPFIWLLGDTRQPLMLNSWRREWVARNRRSSLQPRQWIIWRNTFIRHVQLHDIYILLFAYCFWPLVCNLILFRSHRIKAFVQSSFLIRLLQAILLHHLIQCSLCV